MSKLGAHIVPGSRNGYGPLCEAKPAVVLATNDGGALGEAWQKSGGHTYTIFRNTVLYKDAPHGIDRMTPAQGRALADTMFPQLRASWSLNPAEFYTCLNEPAGNDMAILPTYLAYELRVMELAEQNGIRLCVLNLAGGTPGDADGKTGLDIWKANYVAHIRRAFQGGHIYGRHCYGGPKLSVADGNTNRAFLEAAHLRAVGLGHGGIVITEAGRNGGYGYAGDADFIADVQAYNAQMMGHSNIIGACLWTLGEWDPPSSNWQTAIPGLIPWMVANPTPKWTPGNPPAPPDLPKIVILKKPQKAEMTEAENAAANTHAWSNYGRTTTHSIDDMLRMLSGGNSDSYAILAYPERASQAEAAAALQAGGFRWVEWPTVPTFAMTHWPTRYKTVNQRWGANPEYYAQFGLPGHDGVDIRALLGTDILAVAPGVVSSVYTDPNGHNYGIHVRLDHGDGWQTIYAHLQQATVTQGQQVTGGAIIGKADSTGNSTGTHLHFGLKRLGYTYTDPVTGKVWPFNLFNPESELMRLAPDAFPATPPPVTIDLLPYVKGDGRLYEVQTVGGGQERFQTQASGNVFWQTKNSQFEELAYDNTYIWRGLDTSPGPAPTYAERPGALRYYTAKETGQACARWCKRHMAMGETFAGPGHIVRFYYKDNCQPSAANSGNATNKTTLVAKHASRTWNGVTVQDVIEMTNGNETWFFARGFGLVAWASAWGSSAISEIHAPGTRPNNTRETGCFSG